MWRFMILTFGFLAFAFYELSGGADYKPREDSLQVAWAERAKAAEQKRVALAQAKPQRAASQMQQVAAADADDVLTGGDAQVVLASAGGSALTTVAKPVAVAKPVVEPEKAETLTQVVAVAAQASTDDIRTVKGSRVNLRGGPGTKYPRVGRLVQGDEVSVLSEENGWVKLRVKETGRVGYMADFLLTAAN